MDKIIANELPQYSATEFHERWSKARISAINKSIETLKLDLSKIDSTSDLESDLIEKYFSDNIDESKKKDTLLKNVFDYSRHLALSLSKFLKLTFEIADFQELLQESLIPCAQGEWESRDNAKILVRNGCDSCVKVSANACDYWREAIDGLVMGLGEKERFARHASKCHGDDKCIDIIFTDTAVTKNKSLAYGPIPEHMSGKLKTICEEFEIKMKKGIVIKGLNEGVLYFEFASSTDSMCGGTKLLTFTFQRKVQENYPGLLVKETSPCAVLGVEV